MYWYEIFSIEFVYSGYYYILFFLFNSPGCRAIIQKISGCDWIQCSQCKIEICVSNILIV